MESLETLVQKNSVPERNLTTNPSGVHVQYATLSNTNAPAPTAQVIVAQPAPISKAAKPVRDSAQFVSVSSFSITKYKQIHDNLVISG